MSPPPGEYPPVCTMNPGTDRWKTTPLYLPEFT
jgi:hypothetical protein